MLNFNPTNDAAQEVLNACTQFVNEWEMIYENGSNLLMIGRPGTGKKHLAVAIMRGLMETYVETNVYMTTAQRIIRAMRDSWRQNSERTEYDVIGFYCEKDLLVIDEIGMQHGTDSERLLVSEIINTRYERMLPCILISNFTRDELDGFLGIGPWIALWRACRCFRSRGTATGRQPMGEFVPPHNTVVV